MKGWFFQSHRHSLAARGIKTNISSGPNFAAKEGFLFGSMRRGSERALKEFENKYKVTEPAFKEASVKFVNLTPEEELERNRLAKLQVSRPWSPSRAYESLIRAQQRQQQRQASKYAAENEAMRSEISKLSDEYKMAKEAEIKRASGLSKEAAAKEADAAQEKFGAEWPKPLTDDEVKNLVKKAAEQREKEWSRPLTDEEKKEFKEEKKSAEDKYRDLRYKEVGPASAEFEFTEEESPEEGVAA
jgi:hypothetical protein